MQLLKYIEAADLCAKSETERAKLLCFYSLIQQGFYGRTLLLRHQVLWLAELQSKDLVHLQSLCL